MGLENGLNDKRTKAERSEEFDGPVYDRLKIFGQEIKAKLAANPEYDTNGHWSNSVARLKLAGGKDQVEGILEINGWDANNFPDELLDEPEEN